MVSVFSGEVNRTWRFIDSSGAAHEVSLYHHPLTGARAAMVDHEEVAGSLGTSSVFHGSTTSIPFSCGTSRGYISIQRDKWLGFSYTCVADGKTVAEATAMKMTLNEEPRFEGRVTGHCVSVDHSVTQKITWYVVETRERASGRAVTLVHRRFRDFVELDESVQAALSGHHIRSSLPSLPAKRLKFAVDHGDKAFVADRAAQLDLYSRRLTNVPHAWAAPATAPFFGVATNAREYSMLFPEKLLGFTIGKSGPKKTPETDRTYEPPDFPAFVASIQSPKASGPHVGHLVSKLSGRSTCAMAFKDVINAVKHTPRPILIHFIAKLSDDSKDTKRTTLDGDDTENVFADSSSENVFADPSSVTL